MCRRGYRCFKPAGEGERLHVRPLSAECALLYRRDPLRFIPKFTIYLLCAVFHTRPFKIMGRFELNCPGVANGYSDA
jgi:hypothetical protein